MSSSQNSPSFDNLRDASLAYKFIDTPWTVRSNKCLKSCLRAINAKLHLGPSIRDDQEFDKLLESLGSALPPTNNLDTCRRLLENKLKCRRQIKLASLVKAQDALKAAKAKIVCLEDLLTETSIYNQPTIPFSEEESVDYEQYNQTTIHFSEEESPDYEQYNQTTTPFFEYAPLLRDSEPESKLPSPTVKTPPTSIPSPLTPIKLPDEIKSGLVVNLKKAQKPHSCTLALVLSLTTRQCLLLQTAFEDDLTGESLLTEMRYACRDDRVCSFIPKTI